MSQFTPSDPDQLAGADESEQRIHQIFYAQEKQILISYWPDLIKAISLYDVAKFAIVKTVEFPEARLI